MEFSILGPLAVRVDGRDVAPAAAKPRALLVRLLVDANRPVSAERLIDDLWDREPPRSAAQTLQGYVSQLRKAVGAERLLTGPGGYQLVVAPDDELDVRSFEAAVSAGRRALAEGNTSLAVEHLARSDRHWRGPPLADAGGSGWAVAETARLEELHLVAREALLEAHLELGEHADVISGAEAAVAEHPLRERLWATLMTALYRQGRQADALRAFQRLRRVLTDELGIEPSRELQQLEARMLRQEPDLVAPRSATMRPTALPTGTVTFLLTDVIGSTRLWESAPEAMAEAVAQHEELIRDAVAAHGGVFLKSKGEGDSTFSVFQRATDAIAAAVEAQGAMASATWPRNATIELRVAAHTGEAMERDGDYYGRAVNRAARLRAVARGGVVTVSQATAELGIDDLPEGWHLVELGVQELRDMERPETVYLVSPLPGLAVAETEVTAPTGVPLPRRITVHPTLGFVGRTAERDVLDAALKQATAGNGRVVLLAGEPGIGKTSLAAEIARAAHADGATVLFGRCDEDAGVPYRPWVEALGHLVAHTSADVLARVGDRQLTDLSRLVQEVSDRKPGLQAPGRSDPDADRWSLFAAVASLVGAASTDTPLVLVLDDLQWADKPSLLLLRHVIETSEQLSVLVLGTYRDSDLTADHPLTDVLAALRRQPTTDRVTLRGLADREVVALIESVAGHELDGDGLGLVHAVHRETDGNPFFVAELLRHLAETGAVRMDEGGRWTPRTGLDEAGLPESIREVVGRRVERLGEDCARVLNVAAIIGQEFELATVAAVLEADEDFVLDTLESAESAGLITSVTPSRFAFAHALVAHTLYDGLTPTRRARLHRQVAEAIEVIDPSGNRAAELARHWAGATAPADIMKAISYAREAGDLAIRALAPDEAVRWYSQALELLAQQAVDDDRVRCDLLVRLGRAQRNGLDPAYAETLLQAARLAERVGDSRLLARAALASSTGFVGTLEAETSAERIEVLESALAAIDADQAVVRTRLLATLSTELTTRDRVRGRELSDEALAIARQIDEPGLLAHVLNTRFFALWGPETLNERRAITAEALELAERLQDRTLQHWAATWAMHAAIETGDIDEGTRHLDEMATIAAETGQPSLQWTNRSYRASLLQLHGETSEADRIGSEAVQHGADAESSNAAAMYSFLQDLIARQHGNLGERVSVKRLTLERPGDYGLGSTAMLALALVDAGQLDEAQERLADALSQDITSHFSWLGAAATLTDVCLAVGSNADAEQLLELIAPYHAQVASTGAVWFGSTAYFSAVLASQLGRFEEAEPYFAEANEMNQRIRAPFFLARTRLAWARMLLARRARGDVDRAGTLLESALELAREHGCAGVEREVTDVLASPAMQPPPPPLPPRLAAATRSMFVGREAERESLALQLRAAGEGRLQLALLAGEPGIGKTALAATVAAHAHAGGAWVLHGRCDEDLRVPYHPFVEALAQLIEQLDDRVLDAIGDRRLAELVRIVPTIADQRPSLPPPQVTDPETERYLLMSAAVAALSEAATRAPLVFVVDDLHLADRPTLVLLRHVLSSIPAARLLIIATYRHTELFGDVPLVDVLPTLRSDPSVHHISIQGLSAAEVALLTGADGQLADALHRETDGNPFFADELFRHLRETGAELRAGVLPDAVRGLVRRRVARLGDDVQTTLVTASAIGQEFDLDLLAHALELDANDVLTTLERAESAALVETIAPERFAFAHALIQHSLYDELPATRRARTHRRLAESIEALGLADARITELARHWAEAAVTPADLAIASDHAVQSGDRALDAAAPDEAVRWYQQALELRARQPSADEPARCHILLRLAGAQLRAGDPGFRESRLLAAELADRLGDVDSLVAAALTDYERGYSGREQDAGVLELALTRVGGGDSLERARLLARFGYDFIFEQPDRARAMGIEAIEMARRLGDKATLAEVLASRSWGPALLTQRRIEQDEAIALAEELGDPTALFQAVQRSFTAAMQAADIELAVQFMVRGEALAEQIGRPDLRWIAMNSRAYYELHRGNTSIAEELFDQAYELGRDVEQVGADVIHAAGIQSVRWHEGRQAELTDRIASVADENPNLSILRLPLTLAQSSIGDEGLSSAVETMPNDGSWLMSACIVADIIARRADTEAAALMHERLSPYEDQFAFAGPISRGAVAHSLAVLARVLGWTDEVERLFDKALAMHERMGAPFFQARTLLEWGSFLLPREQESDTTRGRDMLTRARAIARERGYSQIERRAERLLPTSGSD